MTPLDIDAIRSRAQAALANLPNDAPDLHPHARTVFAAVRDLPALLDAVATPGGFGFKSWPEAYTDALQGIAYWEGETDRLEKILKEAKAEIAHLAGTDAEGIILRIVTGTDKTS